MISSFITQAIGPYPPVTVDPKFTWLFTGLAVACFISGCLFWLCFRGNDREEMDIWTTEERPNLSLNRNFHF
ncbi:ANM_HP_G0142960.mRNA.1.CDS.1 [Saccharomyces cerevisiae]|nr:ANM_HP_G0142960.mRNA.1.CDS.1 [Saccharomyces cerevisiae]CAI6770617.1 ANM_HP_G0142960.mRNA.1.CDS.1 [Saccharomyces cerevisiae]